MRNRRPPRLVDWLTSLLLLGGIAVSAAPRAAEAPAGTVVRDLYYGEALFHFYKQDDFTALTHLVAARAAGRVPHHEAEAELLLGGLHLSWGQHERAAAIFERLLAGTPTPSVRDRAWFYLGKVRYQRGLHREALDAFGRVGADLPEALAPELPMLFAQAHMALGEWDEAGRALESWDAPDSWLAYARYNLGVALVRMERIPEGARLLDRVGRMDAATPEQKGLRDKANLALGFAWLQANDAAQARPVLQRVRLQGAFASKALLGAGWADALAADYRAALVPWLELVERDLLDSAVQESFLAVPYALGRLEAHGPAVGRYERALATFDDEIGRLDAAIARARGGALLPPLLEGDDEGLGRWYWQMPAVPSSEDSRYLYHLMAGHEFQEGLKNYRDLKALGRHLAAWRESLDAYSAMVEARVAAHAGRVGPTDARLAGVDVATLAARREALAHRLEEAAAAHEPAALATASERDQWRRLQAIGREPRLALAENAALAARHRILQGVLYWDLDRRFKERLWRERRELAAIEVSIASAQARLDTVREARSGEPRRFEEFAVRIAALAPRIDAMQVAVDRSLRREEGVLVALAERELGAQKERLASYRVQARFALATLYDRAATAQAAAAAPGGTR